jgi:preprotein translocase subunit YajC
MYLTLGLVTAIGAPALGAPSGDLTSMLVQVFPFLAIIVLFYLMIMRPQQRRAKEHQARIAAVKRGDTVVLSSGMIGKVVRVEDQEVGVEIAQNVTVKVVKSMVAEVRTRGEPAPANDAKS